MIESPIYDHHMYYVRLYIPTPSDTNMCAARTSAVKSKHDLSAPAEVFTCEWRMRLSLSPSFPLYLRARVLITRTINYHQVIKLSSTLKLSHCLQLAYYNCYCTGFRGKVCERPLYNQWWFVISVSTPARQITYLC